MLALPAQGLQYVVHLSLGCRALADHGGVRSYVNFLNALLDQQ